jgi:hypothetical protein
VPAVSVHRLCLGCVIAESVEEHTEVRLVLQQVAPTRSGIAPTITVKDRTDDRRRVAPTIERKDRTDK